MLLHRAVPLSTPPLSTYYTRKPNQMQIHQISHYPSYTQISSPQFTCNESLQFYNNLSITALNYYQIFLRSRDTFHRTQLAMHRHGALKFSRLNKNNGPIDGPLLPDPLQCSTFWVPLAQCKCFVSAASRDQTGTSEHPEWLHRQCVGPAYPWTRVRAPVAATSISICSQRFYRAIRGA